MFTYKTMLVELPINCPNCGHNLNIGDIMYNDSYRGETVCGYCKKEYEDDVIAEERENGRLLK